MICITCNHQCHCGTICMTIRKNTYPCGCDFCDHEKIVEGNMIKRLWKKFVDWLFSGYTK